MLTSTFFKKQSKGFTLIELLVVIAIIGILSSVVLASLNIARMKSRDARRLSDMKQMQNALALYVDACTRYPADIYAAASGCSGGLSPKYMAVMPTDPSTQANYAYAGLDTNSDASNCEGYHVGATLEDGTNNALKNDIDGAGLASVCTGSAADFDGADPVYDLQQ